MSLLSHMAAGAAGYIVSDLSHEDSLLKNYVHEHRGSSPDKSLNDIIREYAAKKRGVYTRNNALAKELHDIAKSFEEYNYDDVYGDGEW